MNLQSSSGMTIYLQCLEHTLLQSYPSEQLPEGNQARTG
jgi:hypothetical protein